MSPGERVLGRLRFRPGERTLVMGVVNVTPDSFSDGGRFATTETAVAQGLLLAEHGADILDVGGESSRPGHTRIPLRDEMDRVVPVITGLRRRTERPISIDTVKPEVADAALEAGADIVNDIWGLQDDPRMAEVAARRGAGLVAMHNRHEADPAMDIMADMAAFFERTLALADRAGIVRERIVLDPGIGFGKSFEQNLIVLARLGELRRFGLPILLGTSRKSFIGRITGAPATDRLAGTVASCALGVAAGIDIVRVHDVREHVQACQVADAICRGGHA
ncbi:dihydropteroate synthase [Marinivivus vitaminiproducens]|uniref:dihydropteroate synthase n=1 Tax=Marinivivus vitaminiproducens TaxID=3035935 RepID=UPI00279AAD32|nr:dihydropteroate synthase [Geminicoccaceae bacterium SCSIO 64248]